MRYFKQIVNLLIYICKKNRIYMKNIINPNRDNILIHFPIENCDKETNSFEKIYSTYPIINIDSFSILKNTPSDEKNTIHRDLNIVVKRNAISLEMEKIIAGKKLNEFKKNEPTYYQNKEDYYFNETTLRGLNIDIEYNLVKKGQYLMTISEEKISILFLLVK